ncbi:hypothetical protein BGX38DRAFT_1138918 [Terfezia claveryi]|nr:hypothetical protein BGX38DRAFT_1138918 [Terfezia claveryi]
MCINNTYSCPTCHRERKETISCVPRYRLQQQPKSQKTLSPTLEPPPRCDSASIISQHLLATCQSCNTAYRAAFEQTLRRSIAMSRSGSGSSDLNDGDVEMEDPHARLLADERQNARIQWEAYGRKGRERLCKRRGVSEDEILYM